MTTLYDERMCKYMEWSKLVRENTCWSNKHIVELGEDVWWNLFNLSVNKKCGDVKDDVQSLFKETIHTINQLQKEDLNHMIILKQKWWLK